MALEHRVAAAAAHECPTAQTAEGEPEAADREEHIALTVACREARQRSAELEGALARQQADLAASTVREAALRAELDAAHARTQAHSEKLLAAETELARARTSLADADEALRATRSELARATEQVVSLSTTRDEIDADRTRLAGELASAKAALASSTDAIRRDGEAAQTAHGEREAQWSQERAALTATCRQAEGRTAELEAALARQGEEKASWERREAALQAELDAARVRAHDEPEQMPAEAELERVRTSLTEAGAELEAVRDELARKTDQVASLSQAHDATIADRCRLATELAAAEERTAELERRLEELGANPAPFSRPIPL